MLTVEELKNLQVGDWVWIVVIKDDLINKAHNGKYYHKQLGLESLVDKEFWCGWQGYGTAFEYTDYGTKWLPYKNKEEMSRTNFEKWKDDLTIDKAYQIMQSCDSCDTCPLGKETDCYFKHDYEKFVEWANKESV